MKTLSLISLTVLALGGSAQTERSHALHGLFCNSEAQIDETLARMRQNLTPQAAVELTNEKQVVCVYADKIEYMVVHPVMIGEILSESSLIKYQATLVGVLVGGRVRPVEPSVEIFFVTPERLTDATAIGKA